eukprot:1945173-Pyramimonas_sp.AAC.1
MALAERKAAPQLVVAEKLKSLCGPQPCCAMRDVGPWILECCYVVGPCRSSFASEVGGARVPERAEEAHP